VRCATRFVLPSEQIGVDPAKEAVSLVHHLELFNVRMPDLAWRKLNGSKGHAIKALE